MVVCSHSVLRNIFAGLLQPINALTPIARQRSGLTVPAKIFNFMLSQLRVVVENRLGRIKRFKVLEGPFRSFDPSSTNGVNQLTHIWRACAGIIAWLEHQYACLLLLLLFIYLFY